MYITKIIVLYFDFIFFTKMGHIYLQRKIFYKKVEKQAGFGVN